MALSASFDVPLSGVRLHQPAGRGTMTHFLFGNCRMPGRPRSIGDRRVRVVAEHYLFEEYLAREDRRPPTRMQAYYRIKSLIPAALRHRLNSAAIRMRGKREFPQWPFETALIDYWRQWMQISLQALNETTAGTSDSGPTE